MLRATAGRTEISAQNKTHFAYRFLVVSDNTVRSFVGQEVHRRRSKTDIRDNQSDLSFNDLEATPSNEIVPYRLLSVQANQIVPYGLLSVQANQIVPYGLLSVQANQIVPYGLISVQVNQIVPYGLKSRTSQSDRSIRTQKPYNPIISLGRSPARISYVYLFPKNGKKIRLLYYTLQETF